jgi:flavin reductase (NADH)
MANLSSAVSVITTGGPAGTAGMTVSAACSVTDTPPTMLVCVNQSSRSHGVLLTNRDVCINVLGSEHESVARTFAGATGVPFDERFAHGRWGVDARGVPVLGDALASVVGTIVGDHDQGSHSVLFIDVHDVATRTDSGALVYFQRRYLRVAAG